MDIRARMVATMATLPSERFNFRFGHKRAIQVTIPNHFQIWLLLLDPAGPVDCLARCDRDQHGFARAQRQGR